MDTSRDSHPCIINFRFWSYTLTVIKHERLGAHQDNYDLLKEPRNNNFAQPDLLAASYMSLKKCHTRPSPRFARRFRVILPWYELRYVTVVYPRSQGVRPDLVRSLTSQVHLTLSCLESRFQVSHRTSLMCN